MPTGWMDELILNSQTGSKMKPRASGNGELKHSGEASRTTSEGFWTELSDRVTTVSLPPGALKYRGHTQHFQISNFLLIPDVKH